MNAVFTLECCVQFNRRGRGSRKKRPSNGDSAAPSGRVPWVSRLMALAIRMEELILSREVTDYAELAQLGQVSRARLSQIMTLNCLAPDLQEEILFLPLTVKDRDPIQLRHLLPIAVLSDWRRQRARWKTLRA